MSRITEAHQPSDQRERVTTIEIEVQGRWDALALSTSLTTSVGSSMPARQAVTASRFRMRSR
jgi:hypothetical protein